MTTFNRQKCANCRFHKTVERKCIKTEQTALPNSNCELWKRQQKGVK
jgi:hypothetical protein